MTRRTRAATVDDDASVQEVGLNGHGKGVKVKQENAKKGKARRVESDEGEDEGQMPSQPNGVEANGVDQDAEGEEFDGDGDEEEQGTPMGRKRARVNSVGASVPASPNQVQPERVKTLPRDKDG